MTMFTTPTHRLASLASPLANLRSTLNSSILSPWGPWGEYYEFRRFFVKQQFFDGPERPGGLNVIPPSKYRKLSEHVFEKL